MRKVISTTLTSALALIMLIAFTNCDSKAQQGEYEITEFSTNFDIIWEIAWGPDEYLWVSERPGKVQRVNSQTGEKQLVLDISNDVQTGSERGLMGMALSPTFIEDGFLYLSFTYQSSSTVVKIVRYKYDGTKLIEPLTILDNIPGAANHDGCRLQFGPDGKLYITTGDAQNTNLAQDLTSINGKVLRINPDGSIPEDNPYFGMSSRRNEIWSYGHRNPQGLVIHDGIIYSSEHGANTNDELNIIEKDRNYGWPNVEGMCNEQNEISYCEENNIKEPLAIFYENKTLAVAGIDFYDVPVNAKNELPAFQNSVLMTTLKTGILMQIKLTPDGMGVVSETNIIDGTYGRLRAVCVAPDGRIFVGTSNRDGRGSVRQNDDKILMIKKVGTNDVETNDNGLLINIYPNPSYGSLYLESASEVPSNVSVFDNLGNKVKEFGLDAYDKLSVETNELSSGRYNFQISNNGTLTNKFVNIIN